MMFSHGKVSHVDSVQADTASAISGTAAGEGLLPTSDPAVRGDRTLHWDHTIDRNLVHRNAIAEVLLTDLLQTGENTFLIGAQWSRSHRVYRPNATGRHDPMLILESIRQSGLAVSHQGFGVGFDQQSLMRDVGFTLDPGTEPRGLLQFDQHRHRHRLPGRDRPVPAGCAA